jgi:hypothetical protein
MSDAPSQAQEHEPPWDDEPSEWTDCWSCGGEGVYHDCFDGLCVDAESGCEACERTCDICRGAGGWSQPLQHNARDGSSPQTQDPQT